jgi:Cu-processing system ATP-binding protein
MSLAELTRQARLPIVVRLKVVPGSGARVAERIASLGEMRRVNDHKIELSCLGTGKMALLRDIAGLGDVIEDVDVLPPRLDELYNHYMDNVRPQ